MAIPPDLGVDRLPENLPELGIEGCLEGFCFRESEVGHSWQLECICRFGRQVFRLFVLTTQIISKHTSAVFVLMTVNAEIFPVGAIRRIIPVVAVLMVHCQEMTVLIFKFPSAFCAYKAVYFQRLFPVIS